MKSILSSILFFCVLIGFESPAKAQNHPYSVQYSYEIEAKLAEQKISPSRAGLLYSLIGDYHNSIKYSEIPVSWGVDTLQLDAYTVSAALEPIIEKARNHQIVIISENHLKPQHRIFANEIITHLSKVGFGHLGLETFANLSNSNSLLDSELVKRGYPLDNPMTGTYTLEPSMGNLVRNAAKSKLKFFAYEQSEKIKGKDRDEVQADNIIRYLKNNPNAKVIILCGFHHAIESDIIKRRKSFWMAKYLKDKLEVDPLTIYQDNFTEKITQNEHPYLSKINLTRPSVLIDHQGEMVRLSEHVDIEVIHPRTAWIDGRPDWIFATSAHQSVNVRHQDTELGFPMIAEAHLLDEANAVPLDRIELKHKYDTKVLVLPPGEYRIKLYDNKKSHDYYYTVE